MWRWGAATVLALTAPAWADIPLSSLRPVPRPQIEAAPPIPEDAGPVAGSAESRSAPQSAPQSASQSGAMPPPTTLRPRPRPASLAAVPGAAPSAATAQPDASIRRLSSVRPPPRPAGLAVAPVPPEVEVAAAPEPKPKPETRAERRKRTSRQGSVCGEASIKGDDIPRISSKVSGCGIAEPVRVTSVSGVRLSQPATLDCDTARALNRWVETGLQPAFGRTKVVELQVAAHYICRSRNNIKGGKISEHGRGKAIDIAAVTLENGKTMAVLGGFGKELRRAYKAGCGIFGTTLGPGSDGFHEDHMHFDTASHRSGPYCR